MIKVIEGQDPYSVIGKYIRSHINAIEDIIAVIEIDGVETNQLFMVNMNEDGYFIWKSDWYEGEKDIVLIDFFPVSEAKKSSAEPEWIPVSERLPDEEGWYLVTDYIGGVRWIEAVYYYPDDGAVMCWSVQNPIAWMRCPDPYCDADTTGGQI